MIKKERKQVDIAVLKTPEKNTRIHPEKQINEIRRSLKKWGQYRDVVIDENNMILAGNGLVESMRKEGFDKAWVVRLEGLSENEKIKFMLADNKTAGLGIDHLANIELLIGQLAGDFDIPGFDDDVLSSINAASEEISLALEDYGKASEANIRDIESNSHVNYGHDENAVDEDIAVENAPYNTQQEQSEAPENSEEDRKVICPKCGAEIWL